MILSLRSKAGQTGHAMYSCQQKRRAREQEGREAQISLNRRKEGQINMIGLGKGILVEMCMRSVVVKGKGGSRVYQALRSQLGSRWVRQRVLFKRSRRLMRNNIPWTKLPSTRLPVCKRGWPTTILRNLSRPFLRSSMTASSNLLK